MDHFKETAIGKRAIDLLSNHANKLLALGGLLLFDKLMNHAIIDAFNGVTDAAFDFTTGVTDAIVDPLTNLGRRTIINAVDKDGDTNIDEGWKN